MVAQTVDRPEERDEDRLRRKLSGLAHREEWIVADELEVDHSYQRKHIRQGWVKELAENFDPERFRPLLVNRRRWDNQRLFVMDGQHRLLAIRRMRWGDQKVPCLVYDDLSYEVESKLFDTQGSTKALLPAERFRSALQRHEPEEEIIDGLVRRAGFQLNLDTGDMTEGRIPGVQALKAILRRNRSSVLADVLDLCHDGFGTELGPRAAFLTGLALFLARFRNDERFDRRRLVTALRTKTMDGFVAEGRDYAHAAGRSVPEGIAYKIQYAYNYRLGDDRRLPEVTLGRRTKER